MVGRIAGQTYGKMISLGKLHEALHKLGTSAVALEAMIQLEDEQQLAHDNLKRLMNLFQIEDGDLVEISYGDMMRNEVYRLGR